MQHHRSIRRALLSVADKIGIIEFARALSLRGVELLSTGGTARFLKKRGLPVIEVSDYINFPEIMDGRVKTLHPKVHGGILCRRGKDNNILNQYGIIPIDMVVINFYPLPKIIAHKDFSLNNIVENIDIGGPTIARSAAKNYKDVSVIIKNSDYDAIIKEMDANEGSLLLSTRFSLAVKALKHIAEYDKKILNCLENLTTFNVEMKKKDPADYFPHTLKLKFLKKQNMRYGENSHQRAAFYIEENLKEASVATAQQLQGKMLSYNNIIDADTALECVKEFSEPACVIVKHSNPCGVAVSDSISKAYDRAYKADPTSAFGGVIAFNRELNTKTAQDIISRQFVEVIIAPSVSEGAIQITSAKRNTRVLVCGQWHERVSALDFKRVNGGLLVQDRDLETIVTEKMHIVSERQPNEQEFRDALFSWKVAKFVKSNAIVYAKENMTIGIGAGQMSRIYSAKIANIKSNDEGLKIKGFAMASDAFLPFSDVIDVASGVTCIIQSGGSIHDNEVISVANKYNIAMIFTKIRHFRH